MGMFSDSSLASFETAGGSYEKDEAIIQRERLLDRRSCVKHGECILPCPDFDFSGPYCNEHSTQGGGAGRHGYTAKFFLSHCKYLKQKQVKAAILENVTTGEFSDLVCKPQLCKYIKI